MVMSGFTFTKSRWRKAPPPHRNRVPAAESKDVNRIPEMSRNVIVWDGEGQDLDGKGKHQSLTLFGASTGDVLINRTGHLECGEICDLILRVGATDPTARHVGYFFDYDVNMIVWSLADHQKQQLRANDELYFRWRDRRFRIEYRQHKWLVVTDYTENNGRSRRTNQKYSVRIEDIAAHKNCSFVDAMHEAFGPPCRSKRLTAGEPPPCGYRCVDKLPEVYEGKLRRGQGERWEDFDYIREYHRIELDMLKDLAVKLRTDFDRAGFPAFPLYGPAVLARYWMKRHDVKDHMNPSTHEVWSPDGKFNLELSAQYAYMGGRFELFWIGYLPGPLYVYDINSAYAYAITMLPSLANLTWEFVEFSDLPEQIDPYGLYHLTVFNPLGPNRDANPFFHRDWRGEVSFPKSTQGWYWGIEVNNLMVWRGTGRMPHSANVRFNRAWIPRMPDGRSANDAPRPFAEIADLYELRLKMKADDNPDAQALKGVLTSVYGVLAQTKGYKASKGAKSIPGFHQIEWAGWVTALCRSMVWRAAMMCGPEDLVAFETDSIMTRCPLPLLPISDRLGEWKPTVYDRGIYLQSGMGWFHHDGKPDHLGWDVKRRGMDPDTFTREQVFTYVSQQKPRRPWKPYPGKETRFITLGASFPVNKHINKGSDFHDPDHCAWKTRDRNINVAGTSDGGKRWHAAKKMCQECRAKVKPSEGPHRLMADMHDTRWNEQTPHAVPWRDVLWEGKPDYVDGGLAREQV